MKNILTLIAVLIFGNSFSQELRVIYNNRILTDNEQMENDAYHLKNESKEESKGDDYELIFSHGVSLYEPLVLQKDKTTNLAHNASRTSHNYYETIYTDSNKKEKVSSIRYAGEVFLIEEEVKPIAWQIMQETKKLDSYTVRRAEAVFGGRNIIAWFAEEIPVSSGPGEFIGLPGLILQVQFGKRLITAKKIETITENIVLAPPIDGKKHSREEYEELVYLVSNPKEGTLRQGNTTTTTTVIKD